MHKVMRRAGVLFFVAMAAYIQGCAPVDVLNAVIPGGSYRAKRDVAYGTLVRQKLDIYQPAEPGVAARDVVVFIHGGSWQMGDKDDYLFAGEAFARRGYLTIIPNYRLAPEVLYPTFVDDTAAAIAWVKTHIHEYGGNPKRIFLVGHSAGAYNAMMVLALGKIPASEIKGVVGLAGPYDFLPLTDPKLQVIFAPAQPLETMLPIYYAQRKFPPMLLMNGEKDEDVGMKNARNFSAALKASGNTATALYLPGIDHIDIISALARPLENEAVTEPLFHFLKAQ